MLMKNKGKRGAIGATLTWIVAFFIIFFLLVVIYLPTTLFIAGKTFLFERGKPEIEFKAGKLILTENLIAFLESPAEGGIIRNLFFKAKENRDYDEKLKEEMQKFVDIFELECYILRTDITKLGIPLGVDSISSFSGGYRNIGNQETLLKEKGVSLRIFSGQDSVEIKFYVGECL